MMVLSNNNQLTVFWLESTDMREESVGRVIGKDIGKHLTSPLTIEPGFVSSSCLPLITRDDDD